LRINLAHLLFAYDLLLRHKPGCIPIKAPILR
jgi:hypothetical protein